MCEAISQSQLFFCILQMIGWPIYFVVLLVILKVAAYKPTTFPPMPNDNTLDLSTVNPDITAIYIAPNITGVDRFALGHFLEIGNILDYCCSNISL